MPPLPQDDYFLVKDEPTHLVGAFSLQEVGWFAGVSIAMNITIIQKVPNQRLLWECRSRSARANTCSLNWTVYLLRVTEIVDSFFSFIIDLWFKDYSLNRVSNSSGQDHIATFSLKSVHCVFARNVVLTYESKNKCHK
jgi:hypothetical protein